MAGSRKDVRSRLLGAALDLFSERGFEKTTAADIAERANVTERTYFRHFPDKREALFDGEDILQRELATAIANAPVGLSPIATIHEALLSMRTSFQANKDLKRCRQAVISAAAELRERELTKEHHLVMCATAALEQRHVPNLTAFLAATNGIAVLARVRSEWLRGDKRDYAVLLRDAFAELKAILNEE